MMDAFTEDDVTDVVFMTSAQIGKSEVLLNCFGYVVQMAPGPILMILPSLEAAEGFSTDRIAPMIRDTPEMTRRFAAAQSRISDNKTLYKRFRGAYLAIVGANSPSGLASRPIRYVIADEVDKYPPSAGTEGDPLTLAEKRTTTFWNRRHVKCSTPTIKGVSRIEAAYLASDQRKFFVPCPHCGEHQTLSWAQVQWNPGQPESAGYVCPHCAVKWTEGERHAAVRKGEWRATKPFNGTAGFHISELYSPWRTLLQIVSAFLQAKSHPEQLKAWVNTCLGETWADSHDSLEPGLLKKRAENYPLRTVPAGGLLLVSAVDVQGDRLERYDWAFGRGEEAWVVGFEVHWGDPARGIVWEALLNGLDRPLQHELGGLLVPRVVMVDSGGHHTQEVYAFCRANQVRRTKYGNTQVLAIKGANVSTKPLLGKPTLVDIDYRGEKIPRGVHLWPVGASTGKSLVYGRLTVEEHGAGFIHFSTELDETFYDQLTSERLVTRYVKGYPVLEWQLPSGRRNEALDCAVYAFAGAHQQGLPRFRESDWARLLKRASQPDSTPEHHTPAELPSAPATPAQRYTPRGGGARGRGNWVRNW
jgi:phage terminase large subunit GpA-like protein